MIYSFSSYPSAISTVETSIGRAPIAEDSIGSNSKIYNTYEPSSQVKYSPDKYLIAEKIQNALRQQPAYAQVSNMKSNYSHIILYFRCDNIHCHSKEISKHFMEITYRIRL